MEFNKNVNQIILSSQRYKQTKRTKRKLDNHGEWSAQPNEEPNSWGIPEG